MKRLIAVIVAACSIGNAGADFHVDIANVEANSHKATNMPPLNNTRKIIIRCGYCKVYEPSIKETLRASGYTVVEKETDADTRVVLSASIHVPKNGEIKRLDADDITDEYATPIPVALNNVVQNTNRNARRSVLDMDAGVVSQGSQLTGSTTGGIVIGLVGAWVGGLFDRQAAEARQVPGVATAIVEVTLPDHNYGFTLKAAADTPETPDSIVRAAFARAVELLASGISPQPRTTTTTEESLW
jgi:hypothetical protein